MLCVATGRWWEGRQLQATKWSLGLARVVGLMYRSVPATRPRPETLVVGEVQPDTHTHKRFTHRKTSVLGQAGFGRKAEQQQQQQQQEKKRKEESTEEKQARADGTMNKSTAAVLT